MPSLLSKRLSRSGESKEKEALKRASISTESAPPPYTEKFVEVDDDGDISSADLTAGFSSIKLSSNKNPVPDPVECTAHLKLIESFYRLRQTIGLSDGLFGISESGIQASLGMSASEDEVNQSRALYSEKRWQVYISRAVLRFERWRNALEPTYDYLHLNDIPTMKLADTIRKSYSTPLVNAGNLPPIDVLMVWHAYMLNPRAYFEDCAREGRMALWNCQMPWETIVTCVDNENFIYRPADAVQQAFEAAIGIKWDNLDDPYDVSVACARCFTKNTVPWTTCGDKVMSEQQTPLAVGDHFSSATGYADKGFTMVCQTCSELNDHDALCVGKFIKHVSLLMEEDVLMPGTFLNRQGRPETTKMVQDEAWQWTFPSRLFKAGLGSTILRLCKASDSLQMIRVRVFIEEGLKDRSLMKKARSSAAVRMLRFEKVAVRRMMSRYWENSSPFALDLVGAVTRQGDFVAKMHDIDWLHSPALPSTMKRLVVKYVRFVNIMKDPKNMAVPTLDVDLAWHTHQLNPASYFAYTVKETDQFIDHDDKVAETKLNDAFAWTSKIYQKLYGEPYSECTCWYCEATRENHTSTASRLFKTSSAAITDSVHEADKDPRKSVHISAHNAVKPTDGRGLYNAHAKHQADELEKHYQKACARAEKKGRPKPRRDDYYYSTAWGYPVFLPVYMPFYGVPCYTGGIYPVNPGCMALTAGATGACCNATCGGSVGSGACANAACGSGIGMSSGGCAGGLGGSAGGGGCGGGGGGGGCGGGGGGGCGGGGGGC